ncbi:MAG: hypothetical protein IKU38_05375 [Clostridia bacterium]|nr:hypothetical protein [Clostridia bacterium]
MRKSMAVIASLVLLFTLATSSTIAYLQDTDSAVNVMTLGNVKIDLIELERIEQSDENTSAENTQAYTSGKPLYPAVGPDGWAENAQEWPAGGSNMLHHDELKNVHDKFVFVKNTGKSDAYVRTFILFEAGDLSFAEWDPMLHINMNDENWDWSELSEDTRVTYNGTEYFYTEAVYVGNAGDDGSVHKDGVLPSGETTRPSLLQVWLDHTATNDTCEKLDGNGNGTFDVIVLAQAVQTVGFDTPKDALDTAFDSEDPETLDEKIPEWLGDEDVAIRKMLWNYQDVQEVNGLSDDYLLGDSFTADNIVHFGSDVNVSVDLNGKTLTAGNEDQYIIGAQKNSKLRLLGEGTVNAGKGFFATSGGEITIDGGTYNTTKTGTLNKMMHTSLAQNNSKIVINGGTFTTDVDNAALFFATSNGIIEVNGGFFENTADKTPDLFSMGTNKSNTNRIIFKGGTFVNWNPLEDRMCYKGEWPDSYESFSGPWMLVWDGYKVVSETQANGDIWYSVVPE